jgi:hypothetical protein
LKSIFFKNIIRRIKQQVYPLYTTYVYHTVADTTSNISFGIIGHMGVHHRYKNLFIGKNKKIRIVPRFFTNTLTAARNLLQASGMVIISGYKHSASLPKNTLLVPDFIGVYINLPATLDIYFQSLPESARSDIRKVKRVGYTVQYCRDKQWVATFFTQYYTPSMQQRHAEEAYIMPADEITAILANPGTEFLKIYDGTLCVAAMLTSLDNGRYSFLRMGWLEGHQTLVKNGAIAAVYWYAIQRAFKLGAQTIDMGGTPNYFENGVLRYKAKWGARFCNNTSYQHKHLLLNPDKEGCYQFLLATSLIAFNSNKQFIVLSSKYPGQLHIPKNMLANINSWFVLQPQKQVHKSNGGQQLPAILQSWYKHINY